MPLDEAAARPADVFATIGAQAQDLSRAPAANDAADGEPDEARPPVEEIESLCMNCGRNGTTRLLLTAIPFFREIVVMSFACDHCHTRNNEIQAAGTVQPRGVRFELRLTALAHFSRQVVKSDSATVRFVELDVEVPAGRGQLTNVEGLLTALVDDLALAQDARRRDAPDVYARVADVVARGRAMLAGQAFPFRLVVDDPAGNSFVTPDPRDGVGTWERREYARSPAENAALGLADSAADTSASASAADDGPPPAADDVYSFPASCPGCMHPCTTHMKMVDIPHFKQVVLMSTVCDDCGYRSNDVKTGGEIPPLGEKLTLAVAGPADLARDILKSETCALECPELRLHVTPGTLGGRFTTVEGLLTQVRDDLHGQIFDAADAGDSLAPDDRRQWDAFFAGLDAAIAGARPFTLVLTDPFAASFVQPLVDPPAPDPSICRETYVRTADEEDELGLRDMKTEGYAAPEPAEAQQQQQQQQQQQSTPGDAAAPETAQDLQQQPTKQQRHSTPTDDAAA